MTLMRRKAYGVVAAAAALSLVGGGIAFADEVVNDLDNTIDNQFEILALTAGGAAGSVGIKIVATEDRGESGAVCNVSVADPLRVVASSSDATKASVPSTALVFTACNVTQTVSVTPVAAGVADITFAKASDNTNNKTFEFMKARFKANVAAPADSTPPVITPVVTGTLGGDGWYTSNVGLTWTVTDAESAITSSAGCGAVNITADQVATNYTCSATSAGGTNQSTVSIKRDATNPEISGSDVNDTTWRNSPLSASFTASDVTSGLAAPSTDASFTLTASQQSADADTPTTVSKTVTDNAGNSSTRTLSALIDTTKPVVAVTGVEDGATYNPGSVPAAGCSTTDALSGVKTSATYETTGGPVGSVTATCAGAADNAGNTNSASVTYTVKYAFGGFLRPVDPLPTLNTVKAGSSVPVKFSLSGNHGLGVLAGPTSGKVTCNNTAQQDSIEELATAGSSGLSYDSLTDTYNYVWKTDKAWAGTCRVLNLKLADGQTYQASFSLMK